MTRKKKKHSPEKANEQQLKQAKGEPLPERPAMSIPLPLQSLPGVDHLMDAGTGSGTDASDVDKPVPPA